MTKTKYPTSEESYKKYLLKYRQVFIARYGQAEYLKRILIWKRISTVVFEQKL